MTRKALHIWIWGFSAIVRCRSSQVLSGRPPSVDSHFIFRSLQRCVIGFRSGLRLGHSRTSTESSLSHSCVVFAVCLGSLSCWKVNLRPRLRPWVPSMRFSLRISLYFALFNLPSMLTSRSSPSGLLHTCLELWPNSSILVLSDQSIMFLTVRVSFMYSFVNSRWAFMCLSLMRGLCLATLH